MADTSVDSGVSTPEVSNGENLTFPVYIIHSQWSLLKLDNFLSEYGEVGFLRIVYDKDGNETDRNIAILPETSYNALCKDGFDRRQYGKGCVISPYVLRDNNFPGEERTNTLFIPVPKDLGADDDTVVEAINDKLKHLSEWNIIPADSWSINAPLKSREKGGIRGGCFVSFKRDVPIECRSMVRVLITDTYWPESEENSSEERPVFRCFWARARKERTEKGGGKKDPSDHTERTEKGGSKKDPSDRTERTEKGGGKKDPSDRETDESKQAKKREAIQNVVKKAKPVKGAPAKKAATVPIPTTSQPTLK